MADLGSNLGKNAGLVLRSRHWRCVAIADRAWALTTRCTTARPPRYSCGCSLVRFAHSARVSAGVDRLSGSYAAENSRCRTSLIGTNRPVVEVGLVAGTDLVMASASKSGPRETTPRYEASLVAEARLINTSARRNTPEPARNTAGKPHAARSR